MKSLIDGWNHDEIKFAAIIFILLAILILCIAVYLMKFVPFVLDIALIIVAIFVWLYVCSFVIVGYNKIRTQKNGDNL